MDPDEIFILNTVWAVSAVMSIVLGIVFHFYTVRRLERAFKCNGIGYLGGDRLRLVNYAFVIFFQTERLNDHNYPFVPVSESRKLATKKDRFIAGMYNINNLIWMVLLVVISFI
ncbi:hypothetical protein L4C36_18280 [Photobacterium japonica]|uniref:hypothetical protein n=1 Tax=Photobacterium japonica TaxID=2910235 RepID=UPI003D0E6E00